MARHSCSTLFEANEDESIDLHGVQFNAGRVHDDESLLFFVRVCCDIPIHFSIYWLKTDGILVNHRDQASLKPINTLSCPPDVF